MIQPPERYMGFALLRPSDSQKSSTACLSSFGPRYLFRLTDGLSVPSVISRPLLVLVALFAVLVSPLSSAESLPLTLAQALNLALAQNPGIEQQRAGVDRAAGARKETLQGILPTVEFSTGYLRIDSAFLEELPVLAPQAPPQRQITFVDARPTALHLTSVQVAQPLVNLEAWKARAQAGRLEDAAGHALERGKQELAFQVMRSYYGIRVALLQEDAEQRSLAAAERALARAEGLFDEGLVPPADVLDAQAQVADMRFRLVETEGQITSARAQLRRLIGLNSGIALELVDSIPEPPNVAAQSEDMLKQVEQRADLRAQRESVRAAEAGVDRARYAYVPRLNAIASYQWLNGHEGIETTQRGWTVGVSLNWTLFAGGSQAGAVDVARASEREEEARLQGLRQQADAEVESSLAEWRAAWRAWQSAGLASEAAAAALEQREGRYREGLGTLSELLQAQSSALAAEARQVRARYQALIGARRYQLATGQNLLADIAL